MSQALVHFSSFQLRWDISSGSKTSQKRKININILNLVALFLCVFLVNLITRYSYHIVHQRATTCILWTSSAVVKDSYWIVLSWSNSCFWKLEGCTDMANKVSNEKKIHLFMYGVAPGSVLFPALWLVEEFWKEVRCVGTEAEKKSGITWSVQINKKPLICLTTVIYSHVP